MIKSIRKLLARNVAQIGVKMNAYRKERKERGHWGRQRHRRMYNIKMDIRDIALGGMD
jgi:hypothetical protein